MSKTSAKWCVESFLAQDQLFGLHLPQYALLSLLDEPRESHQCFFTAQQHMVSFPD